MREDIIRIWRYFEDSSLEIRKCHNQAFCNFHCTVSWALFTFLYYLLLKIFFGKTISKEELKKSLTLNVFLITFGKLPFLFKINSNLRGRDDLTAPPTRVPSHPLLEPYSWHKLYRFWLALYFFLQVQTFLLFQKLHVYSAVTWRCHYVMPRLQWLICR